MNKYFDMNKVVFYTSKTSQFMMINICQWSVQMSFKDKVKPV